MSKITTEEKSPLLFVEDKYADDIPTARKVHFENSRLKEIYSGATTVFTHFPDYTGNCWIITAFCGLTFFMVMLLLVGTITTTSLRVPRCIPADEQSNKTVVLVYPLKSSDNWKQPEYQIVDKIVKTYENYKIHIILVQQEVLRTNPIYQLLNLSETELKLKTTSSPTLTSTTKIAKKKENKRKRRINDYRLTVDMEARKLLDMLLHGKIMDNFYTDKTHILERELTTIAPNNTSIMSINDLIRRHPNIIIENTTFNQVFFSSPLYGYWSEMNEDLKIFAVRVLHLWQNGGISFDLLPSTTNQGAQIKNITNNTRHENINIYNQKIFKFIVTGKNKYESLPENVVVADDEGLHMMSKIPCHVFFGQILTNLRKAKRETTVSDILKSSISVFCKNYAAERKYCDKLLSS